MTKTQVWAEALKIIADEKISKKAQARLEELLAPKSSGSINPPKLDKDGNIVEAWCRWHQRYEKVDAMVISNGKSKGYCKAAISKWNKANSQVKVHQATSVEALEADDLELAKSEANKAKALKEAMNKPEYFNYDEDWKLFTTKPEPKK